MAEPVQAHTTARRWSIPDIAAELGVGVPAVKKWRGKTIAALKKAGQLDSEQPTCPLPRNALPIPANQVEHVRDGVHPRFDPDEILRWAEQTGRRHPVTKEPQRPYGSGRPADPKNKGRRRRREPAAPPALLAPAA